MGDLPSTAELVTLLKSGEYDGETIMHAWCRLRDQEAAIARLQAELAEAREDACPDTP